MLNQFCVGLHLTLLNQETKDLAEQGFFDLVLASDVLYEHRLVKPLCRALGLLLSETGEAALSVELRPCGVDLQAALQSEAEGYGLKVSDITEMLKIWVTPMPSELQVPPLEKRHRIFLVKKTHDWLEPRTVTDKKLKSRQPWKDVGDEEWYKRSLHFWSKQDTGSSGWVWPEQFQHSWILEQVNRLSHDGNTNKINPVSTLNRLVMLETNEQNTFFFHLTP